MKYGFSFVNQLWIKRCTLYCGRIIKNTNNFAGESIFIHLYIKLILLKF